MHFGKINSVIGNIVPLISLNTMISAEIHITDKQHILNTIIQFDKYATDMQKLNERLLEYLSLYQPSYSYEYHICNILYIFVNIC